jgi:hypothetical protein
MGNLLFLHRSLAYRYAAGEMLRHARALPLGSERRAARQVARALKDLARSEAWLEGQIAKHPTRRTLHEGSVRAMKV